MTREQVYGVLLRLYPKAFHREYEEQLRQAFVQVSRAHQGSAAGFWMRIGSDLLRSALCEHLDAWTHGEGRLALRWLAACAVGTAASGVVILSFMIVVEFLFPTTIDARHVAHSASRNLPTGVYGAIIAAVIGFTQALVVQPQLRRRAKWVAATTIAGGAGFPLGLMFANWLGRPAGIFALVPYFAGVLFLGALVGAAQSVVWRLAPRSALNWIAASAVAILMALLAAVAVERLWPIDPRTWIGVACGFVAWPALMGLVIGVLTIRQLTTVLGTPRTTTE